ncbi:11640_t:CDS:10 [Funneliformis geosporum]|uniref:11640_t:CDS:1 n=1 Tax=Funneliformis geosporum TaxID=1117311 RepID=A0A9W4SHF2_9GLOM|nr:11640_t:CDS:10 [Funneliformis geosporum]
MASLIEIIPAPTIIIFFSSIILFFQGIKSCKTFRYQELSSTDTGDVPLGSTRFSTVTRDVIKLVIILLQIGLFGFLFYWRYNNDDDDKYVLNAGLMTLCWFYALILTSISITSGSRNWGWIINCHLTVFYIVAIISSLLQIRIALYYYPDSIPFPKTKRIEILLSLSNFILSFISAAIAITTPRGPPLLNNNRQVYAAEYSSLWDFIMFSTVNPLIRKAFYQTSFNDTDFDQLPYSLRASTLYNDFKRWRNHSLLYRLLRTNRKYILIQSFFVIIVAVLYYAPYAFLYRFIEFFQNYKDRHESGETLEWGFIYIFGMLISNIALQLSISQNWYWSSSMLQVAIKGQLNSEIYSKALKRYVDSNRISLFATWWNSIIDCPIELFVGLYFLYILLGSSCLYGLVIMVFTLPINHQTAKYYNKTQDKLMKVRDRRVDLMNEVLQGIRMIKFYAWEKNWEKRILDSRNADLKQLRNTFIHLTVFDFVWIVSPVLVTISSFYIFTKIQGHELTASVAFTSLSIFHELRFALNVLPEVFTDGSQAYISIKRIEKFLNEDEINNKPEVDMGDGENIFGQESKIGFENATITWNRPKNSEDDTESEPLFRMEKLNFEFPNGELSLICGPTGSGKTLILMSLLGETHVIDGKANCPKSPTSPINSDLNPSNWILSNSVALVAQQAWLQNASIRSNIIFSLPYDEDRYAEVIRVCSLEKDLEILEDGDMTEIGEKGITLSGGQKQRVALARAVYSRAKHILMDDVLSAVDAHTAKHLMIECLSGTLMKGRTIILVTHHVRLCLKEASYLVTIDNGKVTVAGSVSELRSSGKLTAILEEADSRSEFVKDSAELAAENIVKDDADKMNLHMAESLTNSSVTENVENEVNLGDVQKNKKKISSTSKPKVLVEEEARPTGAVRLRIYKTYVRANGHIIFWSLVAILYIITRTTQIMESWWLKVWSQASLEESGNSYISIETSHIIENVTSISSLIPAMVSTYSFDQQGRSLSSRILPLNFNDDDDAQNDVHSIDYYLNIYILISLSSSIFGVVRFSLLYYGSLRASRKLYKTLLKQVLRAPLRFFDTTPVGRILNRFSKDFETIDSNLIAEFSTFLTYAIMAITTIFVITSITRGIIYLLVGSLYIKASRECKRLDSVTRSPLYSHFTETLIGISTIRAYGATKIFMQDMFNKIDSNHRAFFNMWLVNRWLSVRFSLTGTLVAFFAGIFLLYHIDSLDPGLAGLSLSFALNFTEQIIWTIRRYSSMEMSLNAVERVCEFSELPQEAPAIISPRPPAAWPYNGKIKVENLEVKYASDLEPVLHHISFSIKGGEKVGIVGRTGSGKSTIALSLFRFIEPSSGKILIDDIDISSIGVEDLRTRITIIPQDPILFTGTIRSNLDAFSQYDDLEIMSSLKRVHLIPSDSEQVAALDAVNTSLETMNRRGSRSSYTHENINVFKNLDTPVSEGGKNFSQGQRQLLCLARALLRRNKVILMDEATASIDFDMDEKIQNMIRTEFTDCTIICIAHRLRTVIDYDRILVLDQGNIMEFDSPHNLVINHESLFYKMCQNSGEFDQLMSLALKRGNKDV